MIGLTVLFPHSVTAARRLFYAVIGLALAGVIMLLADASTGYALAANQGPQQGESSMAMKIASPAFSHNDEIPQRYTCDGEDISPPLEWSGVPAETRSLVLIVDDPDAPDPAAPKMTWVHWILYAIPPDATGLAEGVTKQELPSGTQQGLNSWERTDYGGPCPPIGRHRYFHKLYALDTDLSELDKPTKERLEKAMQGHILAQAELIGTYQRSR